MRTPPRRFLAPLALAAATLSAFLLAAQSARAQAINATVVSTSPAQLRLDWDSVNYYGTSIYRKLYRRPKGDTAWGTPIWTSAPGSSVGNILSYTDTAITSGSAYEYKLETFNTSDNTQNGYGTVSGGVNVPVVESRGTLLLLVDVSQTSALAQELAQLQQDLAGDGWKVVRSDLARESVLESATGTGVGPARLAGVSAVKQVILTSYTNNADLKAVYILGHLPVPYSGNLTPDGHGEHLGAWPADTYYADVSGTWTDTSVSDAGASDTRNWNVPGDGKFDQSVIPSNLALQVGRVDFYNMNEFPTSAVSETELLRRYLRKAHDYRYKQGAYANISRRNAVYDGFANWNSQNSYSSGASYNNWTSRGVIGRDPSLTDLIPSTGAASPWFAWMEANPSNTYLLCSLQSAGQSDGNASGNSSDFGLRPSRSVFNVIFGSYLGDWGFPNDYMRASLAGNAAGDSLGLTCFWGGGPNFVWDSMALGETVGYATWVTENNDGYNLNGYYKPPGINGSNREVHQGLMGDPALRLYSVQSPQHLQATSSNGSVTLSWDASTESSLLGYLVYRGPSSSGPFTRLTPSFSCSATYTDNTVASGSAYTYMVKTVKLETTPAGTFQNPSGGVFATITASASVTSIPMAPTDLQVSASNSTTINLTWTGNDPNATGYLVQRAGNGGGGFGTIATLSGSGGASYTDSGPLTPGTTLYYQIIATGSAGNSLPSQIVAVSGFAGSINLAGYVTHCTRSTDPGYADVPVKRIGGSSGVVTVQYTTAVGSNDTALPGVDYTATSGTLTFADGQTQQVIRVPLLKTSPQPPSFFTMQLSNATGGAGLVTQNVWPHGYPVVLVSDTAAPLTSPWQLTYIGMGGASGITTDPGAAGLLNGTLTSAYWGGFFDNTSNMQECGQFIYQTVTGDKVMTARITGSNCDGAALMVSSGTNTSTNEMACIRITNAAAGAQFVARTTNTSYPRTETSLPASSSFKGQSYWVQMTRMGNVFTGAISADGVTWTTLGSATTPDMPSNALWGFFQENTNSMAGAQYDNIAFSAIQAPAAPGNLAAARSGSGVNLTWTDNSGGVATGFTIQRSVAGAGSYAVIGTIPANTSAYSDTTAVWNISYTYQVCAFNNSGTSAFSNTATSGTLAAPSAPSGLSAATTGSNGFALTWTDTSGGGTAGYTIQRQTEGSATWVTLGVASGTTYTDASPLQNTGYRYRVLAINAAGSSAPSSYVTVATAVGGGGAFTPVADAQIGNNANANINYGTATTMTISQDGAGNKSEGYVQFDLSSLAGSTVTSCTMTVTTANSGNGLFLAAFSYALPSSMNTWAESTITWNNASFNTSSTWPANSAYTGYFYLSGSTTSPGTVITDQFNNYVLNALNNNLIVGSNGLVTFYLYTYNTYSLTLATRENPTYQPPKLHLTYQQQTPRRATYLTGSVPGSGTVTLQWVDNASNEAGYYVQASTDGGNSFSTIATTGSNATSLTTSAIPSVAGPQIFRVVAFNSYGSATPSLPLTLSPFTASWLSANGLPQDGSGNGAMTACPANDGITNLAKYALGISAYATGYQGHYSTGTVSINSSSYLSLTYTLPYPTPVGVSYIPESAPDLSGTTWSNAATTVVTSSNTGSWQTITVRDTIPIGSALRRFLRLRFTAPP